MSKSWKSTALGCIGAIGAYLSNVKDPSWVALVGQFLAAIGVAGLGIVARDNDVSSESAGAK